MFAVIKTGGKQYRVSKDDVIAVEKLAGEAGSAICSNTAIGSCSKHAGAISPAISRIASKTRAGRTISPGRARLSDRLIPVDQ